MAPAKLQATYFGVSTILLDDGRDQVLVDGFFSRPSIPRLLFTRIGPKPESPFIRDTLAGYGMNRVRAVLVSHGHWDHALDSSEIAAQTGALLIGSRSVENLGLGRGLNPNRICVVGHKGRAVVSAFTITAYEAPHGPQTWVERWLLDGHVRKPLASPAWIGRYKGGPILSFLVEHGDRRILIHPSAGFRTGGYRAAPGVGAVFLSLGRVGKEPPEATRAYWCEVVQTTRASRVIPIHWDRFTRPLTEPLRENGPPLDDVTEARKRLGAFAAGDGVRMDYAGAGESVDLSAAVPSVRDAPPWCPPARARR